MESFEHRRVVVMGLGRFGGGVGVTRWLASQGADVLATDTEREDRLSESIHSIRDLVDSGVVELRLGEHRVSDFTTADLVVVNPAVPKPWDDRFIRSAQAGGIPITTEIGLVCSLIDRRQVIGVTGSAGKSTVCSMIHAGLGAAGVHSLLGGNIGGSVLEELGRVHPKSRVVLELSSAMLHWLGMESWSPGVAVVTNLEPNHLDWHGTESHYAASKQHLLKHQVVGDAAVLGGGVESWATNEGIARSVIESDSELDGCSVPGRHNAWNAALAWEACRVAEPTRSPDAFLDGIRGFGGLPHRLCLIHESNGLSFFDDSKSTVPKATLLAVQALQHRDGIGRIHLICGGYDKGVPLDDIAGLAGELAGLYTIGQTGDAIADLAPESAVRCGTLDVAVERAIDRASKGDTVLLSPGCASWDQFDHFEARGNAFAAFARRVRSTDGSR